MIQGERPTPAEDNEEIGELVLQQIPTTPAVKPQMRVIFRIEADAVWSSAHELKGEIPVNPDEAAATGAVLQDLSRTHLRNSVKAQHRSGSWSGSLGMRETLDSEERLHS